MHLCNAYGNGRISQMHEGAKHICEMCGGGKRKTQMLLAADFLAPHKSSIH